MAWILDPARASGMAKYLIPLKRSATRSRAPVPSENFTTRGPFGEVSHGIHHPCGVQEKMCSHTPCGAPRRYSGDGLNPGAPLGPGDPLTQSPPWVEPVVDLVHLLKGGAVPMEETRSPRAGTLSPLRLPLGDDQVMALPLPYRNVRHASSTTALLFGSTQSSRAISAKSQGLALLTLIPPSPYDDDAVPRPVGEHPDLGTGRGLHHRASALPGSKRSRGRGYPPSRPRCRPRGRVQRPSRSR